MIADVKQYPNLIKSLSFLLKSYKPKHNKAGWLPVNKPSHGNRLTNIHFHMNENRHQLLIHKIVPNFIPFICILFAETVEELPSPAFLMSWRRRIGKEDESLFFTGCENAGLQVKHIGSRVYCITL